MIRFMVLPSEWLFLDRDVVFENASARRRARTLYDEVAAEVANAPEFGQDRSSGTVGGSPGAEIDQDSWHVMAEVAESYPRLLVWLTEGQVGNGSLRNVFGLFVAVLRLIPGVRYVLHRELFDPARSLAPWRPALYEALLQRQRYDRNREARRAPGARRFAITMDIPVGGTPGLSAVTDVAVITQTGARDVLREKVVRMASGCVGVSGLRGSGKTTLIRDFCTHRYGTPRYLPREDAEPAPLRGLRFVVDAPQAFDARDFLIYLYTCLCRRVITDARFTMSASRGHLLSRVLLPRRTQPRAVVASLAGVGFLLLAAGLAYQAAVGKWPVPPWRDPFFWEVLGAVGCLIGLTAALTWRARQALLEAGQIADLPAEARERLRRLHYQRTDSVARGGTVAGPFGIGVNVGDSRSFTENVMSLPELIDDYRDFVERVVAALLEAEQEARRARRKRDGEASGQPGRRPSAVDADDPDAVGADVRLVIGIDSMDLIDDTSKACAFLDELTSVFGTPNCVYVLSLKPATLAAVDQRTVPLKNSSGGLFDEMVWVDALTLSEAAKLIDRRVTGMPAAFIALCHVLSGGLPRELLRVARAICGVKESAAPDADPATDTILDAQGIRHIPLAAAVRSVIGDETLALRHRTMASAASLDIGATPSWLKLVDSGDWLRRKATGPHPAGVHWIQALLDEVGHPWADTQGHKSTTPATALCDGLIAGLYFLLTVSELFTEDPELVNALITPRSARSSGPGGDEDWLEAAPPVLSDLASARAALGMNPYLAADHVRTARRALAAYSTSKALTADIRLPFLRRDIGGAGILVGG